MEDDNRVRTKPLHRQIRNINVTNVNTFILNVSSGNELCHRTPFLLAIDTSLTSRHRCVVIYTYADFLLLCQLKNISIDKLPKELVETVKKFGGRPEFTTRTCERSQKIYKF